MAADFKENGNVELITEMSGELYALLAKHAKNSRLTVDGAVQQILTVALEHDTTSFQRLAEADRLREEVQAKLLEAKGKLAASESNEERLRQQINSYEHRISWFTNCENCAMILDSSIKETERAEKAEIEVARLKKLYQGGDDRIYEIVARHKAATEGPWWSDQTDRIYRLHGVMARIGDSFMNKQILKAEKKDQRYQEYWPDAGDAAFIENAWADIGYLMWRVGRTEAQVNFLLKMPRRIQSAIGLACPTPDVAHTTDCDFSTAAKVALKVGQEMRDELRTMDEIVPVTPTDEPS